MKRYFLSVTLVILLSMSIFLTGCGNKKSNTNSKKVVVNEVAHSIFYAPFYVAIENGYFEDEGIDLELVTGFGADKTMTALLCGEADIGFMGSEATIYTYKQGAKDYPVNFARLTQRAGNFLVSRKPIENFTWDKIKGSYVLGGRIGGMPEMVFEYILRTHNINPQSDLTIDTSIDFGSTAAAFSGAKEGDENYADFTIEFEPHATLLESQEKGYIVASLGEDSGYIPYTAFSARESYIENNSDTILHFTKALQKGIDYVSSHSCDEIASVIKPQFPETELKTIITIVSRYQSIDSWGNDLIFSKESFDLLQNILIDSEQLDSPVPFDDLVINSYSEEVNH